ncbi:hypothetical protein [Planomicrobium sp. CPCC 101110]|uniref:hypothetical protein n=1 Tax=Planomicrobium sp. CPCC 101110 TaxID=2599619 RepID=UPI0021037E72|nr:hypothetical protein [Planomicrobium sp. CPCC 101110]
MGHLLLGRIEGRTDDAEITVFDATGMALLDIYVAKLALQAAVEQGLGTQHQNCKRREGS